jgi:solute carrier family 25 (mitochondrial adenine nucleotide translocator), member 4/5/6/31
MCTYMCTPATVRRRLHMQSGKPRSQWLYSSAWDCLRQIAAKEGWLAFYKGAGASALHTVGSAVLLVLYDHLQQVFTPH